MNSEHELMTSARILALLSQEKNILRKRPSLAGEKLRSSRDKDALYAVLTEPAASHAA